MLQKNKFKCLSFFIYAFILTFFLENGFAQNSESKPEIFLNADYAKCQQKNKLCIYSGHVVFKKDKNQLEAPTIFMYQNNFNSIAKIVAFGKPAHYFTKIGKKETPVDAKALKIEFYPNEERVILLGKAEIHNDQNEFAGEYIEYDIKKQTIFSKPSENNVTTIILQQNKL